MGLHYEVTPADLKVRSSQLHRDHIAGGPPLRAEHLFTSRDIGAGSDHQSEPPTLYSIAISRASLWQVRQIQSPLARVNATSRVSMKTSARCVGVDEGQGQR